MRIGYNFSDMLKVVPPAVKCLICWEHENNLTELKVLVNSLYVLLTNNYLKRNFSTCAAVYKLVPLIEVHLPGENDCEGVDTKINIFFWPFHVFIRYNSLNSDRKQDERGGGGGPQIMVHRLDSIQTCTRVAHSTSWATGTILRETIRLSTIYMVIRHFFYSCWVDYERFTSVL